MGWLACNGRLTPYSSWQTAVYTLELPHGGDANGTVCYNV